MSGVSDSIAIQRNVLGRMAPFHPISNAKGGHAADEFLMFDPWSGKPMTHMDFFSQHALLLLVIDEVEKRSEQVTDA